LGSFSGHSYSSASISTSPSDDLPVLGFATRELWYAWLADQHTSSSGLWLKIAKKGSGIDSVDYQQALEVALCWGWIDGQRGRFDELHFLTRFTPRKPRSRWSQRNCAIAEALIERRAMQPAGLAAVEQAKGDGRWEQAYPGMRGAGVPEDLERALAANDAAREFFATLDSPNRYAFLYRLHHTPEARRAERIERYVAMLAAGETLH
jgi:uncharacterized protein YdeI (YjbR/CyaY-like superfamily)